MRPIENDFKAIVDALEAGRVGPLSPMEHRIITRFWVLWRWRNYFIDSPEKPRLLSGVQPDTLSKDQREILESQGGRS